MRFDAPVLLYGAGREALSTRAFLATHYPALKVFVTVDSGAAAIPDVEILAPSALPAAISAHTFGTIVKSPGVSRYKPIFALAEAAGIEVTANLNLWGETYRRGRTVIAITGTKGKSTTATLVHLMLRASGIDAGLAGNVGLAPLEIADRYPVVIFELSSYQTADINFLPDIAAVTNLYPEHVDWHGSVDRYFADKLHLIARDGAMRIALGRAAQENAPVLVAVGDRGRLLPALSAADTQAVVEAARTSRLKGAHNLDNALLAAQIALAAGGSMPGIAAGIAAFAPLPHRLEEHRFGGITFVDDSISTTPEATKAALAAYQGNRLALIAGGHERQQDYAELATLLSGYGVTTLLCLPDTGGRLASSAKAAAPRMVIAEQPDLASGMEWLATKRTGFDTVILSPGAPSYNQFKNFEARGQLFIELAERLFS